MSSFQQQNITKCTKKHKSAALSKEKNKFIETVPEEAQTLDLLQKDVE